MLITAFLLPGLRVTSIFGAVLCVVALAFINAHLWSAALFFHVPMELSIHAVALLGANGAIFWIIVKLLPGIEISGILSAILAPVAFTVIAILIQIYMSEIDWAPILESALNKVAEIRDYFLKDVDESMVTPSLEESP